MVGKQERPCAVQQSALLAHGSSSSPQLDAQLLPPSPPPHERPVQQSALVAQVVPSSPQAVRGSQNPAAQGPPQHGGRVGPQPRPLAVHWSDGAGPGGPQRPPPAPVGAPPGSSQTNGAAQSAMERQLPPSPLRPQAGPASPPSGAAAETQLSLPRSQLKPAQQSTRAQLPPGPMQPPLELLAPVELEEPPLLLEWQPARQTVVPWLLFTLEPRVLLEPLEPPLCEEPVLVLLEAELVPLPASGEGREREQAEQLGRTSEVAARTASAAHRASSASRSQREVRRGCTCTLPGPG